MWDMMNNIAESSQQSFTSLGSDRAIQPTTPPASAGLYSELPSEASELPAEDTADVPNALCMQMDNMAEDKQEDPPTVDHELPDGGYGWVVVFASFFIQLLGMGLTLSFGVLYVEIQDVYRVDATQAAWVGAICVGFALGAGPLASAVSHSIGHRPCCFLGVILTSTGLFFSAFVSNIYFLYLTYGLMAGTGIAFTYVPAVVVVGFYFDKRLALTCGVAAAGLSVGSLVYPPLILSLIRNYTVRGAMFILSGLALNMAVFGALLRPQPLPQTTSRKVCDLELVRNRNMILYVLAEICWNIGSLVIITVAPHHSELLGVDEEDASLLLTAIGVAGTVGRLLFVVIPSHWDALTMLVVATFMTGVPMVLYPFWDYYWLHVVFCVVYGLSFGVQLAVMPVVIVNLFGVERLTSAYGLLVLADGIGAMIGPFVGGFLFDLTGRYLHALITGALVSFTSGTLMTIIRLTNKEP